MRKSDITIHNSYVLVLKINFKKILQALDWRVQFGHKLNISKILKCS